MKCPKCGGEMSQPKFCSGVGCYRIVRRGEHMHVACPACGYSGTRPCLDAKEKK